MGVVSSTLRSTIAGREWRTFDVQLFVYVVLLIGIGVVMGYSAELQRCRGRPDR